MRLLKDDEQGQEPDPRFTLANERTFLTWITTSLALSAAAVAVMAVPAHVLSPALRLVAALALVALAALTGGVAFPRWRRVQRALRAGRPLPEPVLAPLLGYGVALLAALALVIIVWSLL